MSLRTHAWPCVGFMGEIDAVPDRHKHSILRGFTVEEVLPARSDRDQRRRLFGRQQSLLVLSYPAGRRPRRQHRDAGPLWFGSLVLSIRTRADRPKPRRCNMNIAALALVAGLLHGATSPSLSTPIKGDYVEARTASVFAGACHYNGEVMITGRDAVMAWNVTSC